MEEADICHDFFVSLTLGKKAQKLSEKEKREYLGGKKEDHNPKFYEKFPSPGLCEESDSFRLYDRRFVTFRNGLC